MNPDRIVRRLAAILAADVVGYSRLMEADEEGMLAALRAVRREFGDPKIAEHRGRIVKTTGDGMLVEFASVVDAVRCAVGMQQAMPERNSGFAADTRIELRIGINLGDVIVEGDDLLGTASTSPRGSKPWLMPAACSSPTRFMITCATGCPLSLRIWASSRCASTGCATSAPPRLHQHRRCRSPTSPRSQCSLSPI